MSLSTAGRRVAALAGLTAVAALGSTARADAVTWTAVPSGTTSEITAIEYQSPTKLWFTTANGGVFTRQADGSFKQTRADNGQRLNDVQFDSTGTTGYAVGVGGQVLRSTDAGASWTPVAGIQLSKTAGGCSGPDEPLGNVNHVRFAGDGRVWILGQGSQLGYSDNGTTWVNANRKTDSTPVNQADDVCRLRNPSLFYESDGIADGYFPSATAGYVVVGYARVLFSAATTDLTTDFVNQPAFAGNAFSGRLVLAGGDPGNSGRMWATDPSSGGSSQTAYTEDGWATRKNWSFANGSLTSGPADVEYAGGTVLAAGDGGTILSSTDGLNFTFVNAPAFATASWRSVGLASATQGAVGGTGGTLLLTQDANALPAPATTTPPTTTPPTTKPPVTTPPATKPTPTLASSSKPPIVGKAAKIRGKYVTFKVKGKLGVPAGVDRKAACKGTMSLSVYKGKKRLATKTTKVKSNCSYKKTVKVKRTKVGTAKKLKLKVAFRGNDVLGKLSSTYNVKVKR